MTTYIKPSDATHRIKVTSSLIYAIWSYPRAHAGQEAELEVRTSFVGDGAKIKITCYTENGKKLDKVEGKVFNNRYKGKVLIPERTKEDEMIFFEAELPQHRLKLESNFIPVRPPILVDRIEWDRQDVRRGDIATIKCHFESGVEDGDEATIVIYEHNPNSCDLKVASIPTVIKGDTIEIQWKFDYQDDTGQIPTDSEMKKYNKSYAGPQFYFVVAVDGVRIGANRESGLMKFLDEVMISFNARDKAGQQYILQLPDGTERKGKLDENGICTETDLPPGSCRLFFPDLAAEKEEINAQCIEIGDTHFRLNSAVFLPNDAGGNTDENEYKMRSSGIVLIERAFRHLELGSDLLLIAGHTDTVGSPSDNTILSLYRSQAVYAILMGDRSLFASVADAPHIPNKQAKANTLLKDKLQIADWAAAEFGWPCSYKRNNFDPVKTFKAFQQSYNVYNFAGNPSGSPIPVDGDWGPLTWMAAFDCYELKLSQRLMIRRDKLNEYRARIGIASRFVFPGHPFVACGEYHPIENPDKDNYYSQTNRRVELIFFDSTDRPKISCVNGECSGKACTLFSALGSARGRKIEAFWENPDVVASHTASRTMFFKHPALAAGEKVFFTVYQVLKDGDISVASPPSEVTASSDGAEKVFDEQSDEVIDALPEYYGMGFSYFFTVENDKYFVASARLPADGDWPEYTST